MGQDPFVAEIAIFPFNFAPKGYAFCDGQLLPLSQNTALFSLVGTFYGGNGKSNFALPNLQGAVPVNQGQSTTGSQYFVGQEGGAETVTLLQTEMPLHNHSMAGGFTQADLTTPSPTTVFTRSSPGNAYMTNSTANLVQMSPQMLAPAGSSFPHNNLMPYLTLNFCIAMQGVYPPRT